jgi:hypothetical protein
LSFTIREEHRLRIFENRVLTRIFQPKRVDVTGGWRKLHNEELHNLFTSPYIIKEEEHVACMGKMNTYKILVGKPKGKRPLGRLSHNWENNVKMDGRETELESVDWIGTSGGLL